MSGLVSFTEGSGEVVAGWVTSAAEASRWAGLAEWPVAPTVFAEWHAQPDVVPFLLVEDTGEPIGYGELWEDEAEAELARLVVDPAQRGRGNGRALVGALVTEARRRGFDEIWLRVVPENETAIRCYHAACFVRASPDEETEFNQGQGRTYLWLRHHETG